MGDITQRKKVVNEERNVSSKNRVPDKRKLSNGSLATIKPQEYKPGASLVVSIGIFLSRFVGFCTMEWIRTY